MTMTIENDDLDLADESLDGLKLPDEPEPEQSEPEVAKVKLAVAMEVNGWEQLTIARLFNMTIQQYGDDLVMASRIALFVDGLRGGLEEGQAFQNAMKLTVSEVVERVDMRNADVEGGAPLGSSTPTT